ncbi:radical SAM protein [bacterium]|nr:radical SAM protein [bacterium]
MAAVINKLKGLGKRLAGREEPLPFPETLSIESSYACNLKCVMCPRHFDESLQGMFQLQMFKDRILPVLPRFKYLHLTGWGEPLMNKDLVEMLRLAKEAGVWSCFTTNGLLLKEPLSRRVLETGVDTINISCDASEPEVYEQVRGKGTFKILMERMAHMDALRKEMNAPTRLEWTFVMMKTNLHQLPDAIRLAAEKNFERFTAKHMETGIDRSDLDHAMWDTGIAADLTPEWNEKYAATVAEARKVAEEVGIELIVHPRRFEVNGECLVRPTNMIFVDYKGNVSTCCYLNKLDVKPYIAPEDRPTEDGVIGNLSLTKFVELLDSDEYDRFRRQWKRGEVPKACYGCVNLNRMQTKE